jgi:hypothetical protein
MWAINIINKVLPTLATKVVAVSVVVVAATTAVAVPIVFPKDQQPVKQTPITSNTPYDEKDTDPALPDGQTDVDSDEEDGTEDTQIAQRTTIQQSQDIAPSQTPSDNPVVTPPIDNPDKPSNDNPDSSNGGNGRCVSEYAKAILSQGVDEYGYPLLLANVPTASVADMFGFYNRQGHSYVAWKVYQKDEYLMCSWGLSTTWVSRARVAGFTISQEPKIGAVGVLSTATDNLFG